MIAHVQSTSVGHATSFLTPAHPTWSALQARFRTTAGTRIAWVAIEPHRSPLRNQWGALLVTTVPDSLCARERGPGPYSAHVPTIEEATRIVRFCEMYARVPEEWAILVHCHMGYSRSPAVATYVQERWKPMNEAVFLSQLAGTSPNPSLLRLLREVPYAP